MPTIREVGRDLRDEELGFDVEGMSGTPAGGCGCAVLGIWNGGRIGKEGRGVWILGGRFTVGRSESWSAGREGGGFEGSEE